MSADIKAKVRYFETVAERFPTMSGEERARTRKELVENYDSLSPSKTMAKYAAGGAVAAGILPGIGWIAGGLIGGVVGAIKADGEEATAARDRLAELLEQVG